MRVVVVQDLAQHGDGLLGRQLGEALTPQFGLDFGGGDAAACPVSPGDGGGGESLAAALGGEGVEEGVAGGVVALSGDAADSGDGGEQDEGVQIQVAGQRVEMHRAVHLRLECAVELIDRQITDQRVVQDGGSVEDTGERQVRRNQLERVGQFVAVGDVGGGDGDLGAEVGEFGL